MIEKFRVITTMPFRGRTTLGIVSVEHEEGELVRAEDLLNHARKEFKIDYPRPIIIEAVEPA